MSVMILAPRDYSLIASYAQAHAVSLSAGQTPEGLAQSLYAANLQAFKRRYPRVDVEHPPLRLTWLNAADEDEVLDAVEMWRHNVDDPADPDLEQGLAAVLDHIAQSRGWP